jgi:hypothetical protein
MKVGACEKTPINLTIEGSGCVEIGNLDFGQKNRLCGPGTFQIGNLGAGIVSILAIPDVGFDITNVMGLPKNKQTKYRKPYFQFYFNSKDEQNITLRFSKAVAVNNLEPDDSIFKSGKKK